MVLKHAVALLMLVACARVIPGDCGGFDQPSVGRADSIPTPAETPAKVIVNGLSSACQKPQLSAEESINA
jgi:hypothetical protein